MQIGEISELVRARSASAVEILDEHLVRVEARNGELNAIVILDEERARAAAAEAPDGPLAGVPFTVKEAIVVEGLPGCEASLLRPREIGARDATVVARLRAAGAILVGKTNISELCAHPDSSNLVYGATRNPYDVTRSAGGSSGGEGAAVASGMSAFGIGSDYGGSIRAPGQLLRRRRHAPRPRPRPDRRPSAARAARLPRALVDDRAARALGRGRRAGALGALRRAHRIRGAARARRHLPRRARALGLGRVRGRRRAGRRAARVRGRRRHAALPARGRAALRDGQRRRRPARSSSRSARSTRRRRGCARSPRPSRDAPPVPVDAFARLAALELEAERWFAELPVLLAPAAAAPAFELGRLAMTSSTCSTTASSRAPSGCPPPSCRSRSRRPGCRSACR